MTYFEKFKNRVQFGSNLGQKTHFPQPGFCWILNMLITHINRVKINQNIFCCNFAQVKQ